MGHTILKREKTLLISIIGLAIFVRVFTIWVGRPEFVGWFNHTYYYFVQVQGLIQSGPLPYSDLPLLFYLYAFISKILMFFGVESKAAIVNSTRLVMTVAPALTAIPIYGMIKNISGGKSLKIWHWVLITVSVFLPLSVVHMPELLQKNMFGMLLFALALNMVYQLLRKFSVLRLTSLLFILSAIFLTHIGTFAVSLLFGVALAIAVLWNERRVNQIVPFGFVALGFANVSLVALYYLDASRFDRVILYLRTGASRSLIGKLFSDPGFGDKALYLVGIILPLVAIWILYRVYQSNFEGLSKQDRIFWLANIVLCYLLAAPFFDVDLVPRFMIFLTLPAIIIFAYHLRYLAFPRLRVACVLLLAFGAATMMFGEVLGVFMRSSANKITHRELILLKEQEVFQPEDLIVTTYAVNPICNWFFETKSTLLTSFSKNDFKKYKRIYVFNPKRLYVDPLPLDRDSDGKIGESEKYAIMRQAVRLPQHARSVFESDNFELFKIEMPPENWKFDDQGNWVGYR